MFRDNTIDVNNRLAELGWTLEEWLEVIDAMVAARNGCTENDPAGAPGWMSWKDGSRRLREMGRPKGLEKSDQDQIPWVFDKERGLRFAVSNTDDGTALPNRIPQNRSKKGPATERVVDYNQGSLFSDEDLAQKVVPLSMVRQHPGIVVSWYLCVFCEGDLYRAELSCPVATENGYFTDFSKD